MPELVDEDHDGQHHQELQNGQSTPGVEVARFASVSIGLLSVVGRRAWPKGRTPRIR